jgi:hypothetical protein
MTVGACDMVTVGMELGGSTPVEEEGDDSELLVAAETLELVMVEGLTVMSVVEPEAEADSGWKPADAAKLEGDEATVVGGMTELVLLRLKNGTEVGDGCDDEETEFPVVDAGVWLTVSELALGC